MCYHQKLGNLRDPEKETKAPARGDMWLQCLYAFPPNLQATKCFFSNDSTIHARKEISFIGSFNSFNANNLDC